MALLPHVAEELGRLAAQAERGDNVVKVVQDTLTVLKAVNCHELIDEIIDVGYVSDKIRAIGCEIESPSVLAFNDKLVATAGGALGQMQSENLKIWQVTRNGKLNLQLLQTVDSAFYRAVQEGLVWDVIDKQVGLAYPSLLAAISRSANTSLQRGEHELQVLKRIQGLVVAQLEQGKQPSYASLKKQVLSTKPACSHSTPHMFLFVCKCSGGRTGSLLEELERFVRPRIPTTRQLPVALWENLCQESKQSPGEPLALFRHALLKLAYVKQCITPQEVKKAFVSRELFPAVKKAEDLMKETRARTRLLLDDADAIFSDHRVIAAQGFTDMALAGHALGIKIDKDEKQYKTAEGIAQDGLVVCAQLLEKEVVSPWKDFAEEAEKEASSSSKAAGPSGGVSLAFSLREYNADGSLADPAAVVRELGFAEGKHVRRRADGTEAVIVEFCEGSKLRLRLADGTRKNISGQAFVNGEWAVFQPAAEAMDFREWKEQPAAEHPALQQHLALGNFYDELTKLYGHHEFACWDRLVFQMVPSRLIRVSAGPSIAKNKVILVPLSTKAVCKATGEELGTAVWQVLPPEKWRRQFSFGVAASFQPSKQHEDGSLLQQAFFVPFWMVLPTDQEEVANMEVIMMSAPGCSKGFKFTCLRNLKTLKEADILYYYKKKPETKATAFDSTPPARKRARKGEAN
ncbi:hypothetical protein AK812_SmicGene2488 [Symbiodinium microadriaticum]|uniref:Uncharacterized protein n=1 Tax=Symbiodinium microadriaticum TaxID=2951 RepID=A0A1Q9F1P4_SYMMI|nr:hypothetical protein AK812_SmicGene2488 [Symbiodinium microadriaticum]